MQLRSKDLTWHVVGDELVVLDLEGSVYLSINGSGRLLWERLAESSTVDDLIGCLVENFDVDGSTAEQDVASFLADLQSRGLLLD